MACQEVLDGQDLTLEKSKAERLHNKLLYTTIAIDYLHSTVDKGIPEQQFRAKFKNYVKAPLYSNSHTVSQLIEILEKNGLVGLGDYDILVDLTRFDARIVDEIQDTKAVLHFMGISIHRRVGVDHSKELHENFIYRCVVMQIKVNDDQDANLDTDNDFQSEIKRITKDLENYGFVLCLEGCDDEKIREYNRNCECLNQRLHESIVLINAFDEHNDKLRKDNILKMAEKSYSMIKDGNDEFYKLQERWKLMNDRMKNNNSVMDSLLCPRGMKRRRMMSNSLYVLLEAESVEKLDTFWKDYQEGHLKAEFQQKLFSGISSTLQIKITEQNYKKYRQVLVESRQILYAHTEVSAKMGGNIELVCETRDIKSDVRWYVGTKELLADDHYSIKQYGYSHRLLIKDVCPADGGDVIAVAGSDKVSIHIAVNGHLGAEGTQDKNSEKVKIGNEISSEELPLIYPSQAAIQCEDCKTETGVDKFCKSCQKSLCDGCAKRHRIVQHTHDIVSRTGQVIRESELSIIVKPCPSHPEYNMSKFCSKCDRPCCIKCIEKDHYHSILAIESKYMECEDKLNDLAKEMKNVILPTLVSNIEQLKKSQQYQKKRCQDVAREVNRIRGEMKVAVDERCDALLDELSKTEAEQLSSISGAISDLEKQIKESEIFISMCSEKVREGGLDLIEFSKVTQPTTYAILSDLSYTIPALVPSRNMLDSINKLVGNLKWEDREINIIKPTKSSLPDRSYLNPVIDIKPLGSFHTDAKVTSVVPTGKDKAWVASWDRDTMTMYDITGKWIRSEFMGRLVGIFDLAVKQSGDVIVCTDDNKVRLVTVSGVVDILFDTSPYSPQGACLREEEIVVCMAGQRDRNHVAVYSPDGKTKVRRIQVKDGKGKQLLPNPYRVVMNGEYISVLNNGSNVVTCDKDGEVRWVYDGSQSHVRTLSATGMCVDKFCNLLISDWNNDCVHYVDREGGLIQILLTMKQHGIMVPCGISVDNETGTVWVGSEIRNVHIFRYLHN